MSDPQTTKDRAVAIIASMIEQPKMSGPSNKSVRRADDIWHRLKEEGLTNDEH